MKTRAYKEIINDLRSFSSEKTELNPEEKEQLNKYADELDSISKDSKFSVILLFIFLVGFMFMWILNSIENDDLTYDNQHKKSLIESYEKIIRFEDDSTHSFTYRTRDGLPLTYQDLMDENYELLNENSEMSKQKLILEHENEKSKNYLDLIKRQYGIYVVERDNKVWVEGAKVDSALMLLNVYRDKLKYDPEKKEWWVRP